MSDNIIDRIERFGSDILKGGRIKAIRRGEGYYAFEFTSADGVKSTLPPVWIDESSTDQQLRDKLRNEFNMDFRPDAEGDDLSTPNLMNEGHIRHAKT